MNARSEIENWGGRRFLLCILVGISATVLQAFGKLDAAGNSYMVVMLGVIGAYITGNTAQKIKGTADAPEPTHLADGKNDHLDNGGSLRGTVGIHGEVEVGQLRPQP